MKKQRSLDSEVGKVIQDGSRDCARNDKRDELSASDIDSGTISETRRDFIRKYGALAAVTPVALTLTMHGGKALAGSCTECGP